MPNIPRIGAQRFEVLSNEAEIFNVSFRSHLDYPSVAFISQILPLDLS